MNESRWMASTSAAAWRLLKGLHPRRIDLQRVSLLRDVEPAVLGDGKRLESLLPALGLNDEGLHEYPDALHPHCGQGLLIWQFPNQFGPYLAELTRHGISSYLEVGVRHGGSFIATVEVLRRFHPGLRSVGVDIIPSPSLIEYAAAEPHCEFQCVNTLSDDFDALVERLAPIDLVFIDSHHEEAQCRHEVARLSRHANMIALHDIANTGCPGIGIVWKEIVDSGDYECREFSEQYATGEASYMGIGLAIRKRLNR